MNSKKNKKNVNTEVDEFKNTPKKIKKKKTELTNENTNFETKTRKRKNAEIEIEPPPKRARKKNKTVENNTDSDLPDDNIENVPSTKNAKQKNGYINTELETEETDIFNKEPKRGKKKKKVKAESQEIGDNNLDLDVSTSKSCKIAKTVTSGIKNNHALHHEVNIVDVKGEKVNENNEKVVTISIKDVESLDQNWAENDIIKTDKIPHHEVNIIDVKNEKLNEDNENVVTISIKDVEGLDSDWDENDLLKQLERKIEKKEIPKERKVGIEWPDVDLKELVERIEIGLPENDMKPYIKRGECLEWDKIAFKNYTPDDCKKTWSMVLKKVRRYRILKEVLQDAKQWIAVPKAKKKLPKVPRHPDMPRRPLSAYFIYYLKKKDSLQAEHPGLDATELAKMCSQKFKLLAPEKKMKYEKIANKNKEEYDQKLKEFHEAHPEYKLEREAKLKRPVKSPKLPKPVVEKPPPKPPKEKLPKRPLTAFQYYHLAEAAKEQVEDKVAFKEFCKERWKQMPDDKKIEWISYAEAETLKYEDELKEYIKNHPEYVHTSQNKPQLTKEDLLVKERLSGKPPKPPVSSYNLFARMLLHSEDIKNVPVKERLVFVSNQWNKCTEEEKKVYKNLFDKTIEKHNKDYAAYLESLPEEERKLELEKNALKKGKSNDEKGKKESKSKKPAKKKVEVNSNKKKPEVNVEKKKPVANKTSSTTKKTEKKTKKLVEPEQPPISPFKYFASTYTAEEPVAKAWKALSSEEKKKYEDELVQKKKAYILDFEKFLKSMTKEELENFSNSRKKQNNQKALEEDEEETSDQSDSDEDSNDEDSGDEEQDTSAN